jgi:hypothetical protein
MGGWNILILYALLASAGAAAALARRRGVLVAVRRLPAHPLLLAAAVLADAAVFPGQLAGLAGPLAATGALFLVALAARNTWPLLGVEPGRAVELLERCASERGIPAVREAGWLILKRHGARVRVRAVLPGLSIVRFDRRRPEPELDLLGEAWRRALADGGGTG